MNCLKCSKTDTCYDWSKYVHYFIKNARAFHHLRQVLNMRSPLSVFRPVAGGGAGGARAPPEIFSLELNSAAKVEFFY